MTRNMESPQIELESSENFDQSIQEEINVIFENCEAPRRFNKTKTGNISRTYANIHTPLSKDPES